MTRDDAYHILELCRVHSLRRPRVHKSDDGQYYLHWKLLEGNIYTSNYDAAFHFMRFMHIEVERGNTEYWEREERSPKEPPPTALGL